MDNKSEIILDKLMEILVDYVIILISQAGIKIDREKAKTIICNASIKEMEKRKDIILR